MSFVKTSSLTLVLNAILGNIYVEVYVPINIVGEFYKILEIVLALIACRSVYHAVEKIDIASAIRQKLTLAVCASSQQHPSQP